jgi:hypothetical protein
LIGLRSPVKNLRDLDPPYSAAGVIPADFERFTRCFDWAIYIGRRKRWQADGLIVSILYDMGFKTNMLYLIVLALAISVPVGLFSLSDYTSGLGKNWFSKSTAKGATTQKTSPSDSPAADPHAAPPASIPSVGAHEAAESNASAFNKIPTVGLNEVLRFDLTVEWVLSRWPRVSTGLQYLQLQGYRVPLVTGGNLTDVAGSLTYYFNARQQVERITLRGTTGDPSVLVNLIATQHGFTRRLTNDPGLVLYEVVNSSNRPVGSLKIRSAQVVKASQPYTRFEVDLTMDRPE